MLLSYGHLKFFFTFCIGQKKSKMAHDRHYKLNYRETKLTARWFDYCNSVRCLWYKRRTTDRVKCVNAEVTDQPASHSRRSAYSKAYATARSTGIIWQTVRPTTWQLHAIVSTHLIATGRRTSADAELQIIIKDCSNNSNWKTYYYPRVQTPKIPLLNQ